MAGGGQGDTLCNVGVKPTVETGAPVRQGDEANFGLYSGDPSNPANLLGRMKGARWEPVK